MVPTPEEITDQFLKAFGGCVFGDDFASSLSELHKLADAHPTLVGGLIWPAITCMHTMNEANKRRNVRIEALESRVADLEPKPRARLKGAWTTGTAYQPGDAVVHRGRLWLCAAPPSGEPTIDFRGWQLASRRTL